MTNMTKQTEAISTERALKLALITEAAIQSKDHPSKDARVFAKAVHDYFMSEQPAQSNKPWVGLEPGEISKIATSDQLAWANLNTVENRQYFARAIEAKLREKNSITKEQT